MPFLWNPHRYRHHIRATVKNVSSAEIREPERNTLAGYQRTGGYEALTRAVTRLAPTDVIETLKESQTRG